MNENFLRTLMWGGFFDFFGNFEVASYWGKFVDQSNHAKCLKNNILNDLARIEYFICKLKMIFFSVHFSMMLEFHSKSIY